MRLLIQFFINRPLLVNLASFFLVAVGLLSLSNGVRKEIFPPVDFDIILITTALPANSAEDVEKLVTIPLERSIKGVSGIKTLNALSGEGNSILYVEVDPDSDLEDVLTDIKNAVDTTQDLPEDATTPIARSLNNKRRSVLKIPLTGGESYEQLREASKKLQDKIEDISSVALVETTGYLKDEIRVHANPKKLKANQVTLGEMAKAIRYRNTTLTAGKIKTERSEQDVRVISELLSIKDIEEVIVRSNDSGKSIAVSDLARVIKGPQESEVLVRSQGKESIFLEVKIKEKADILKSTEKIKKVVTDFLESKEYENVDYGLVDDRSFYVKRRLNVLKNNGIMGLVLVFITLLFFLNFSSSVVTSLGAPLAFMAAFIAMDGFDLSLNLISMFGLILVLGMLVDDSIIVAERYFQLIEGGMERKKAAEQAALETIGPITGTILTTVVAFGSLYFMGGIMGKFLWPVPTVVIICLAASFIECFFILPSHLADFVKIKKSNIGKRRWYHKLNDYYRPILKFAGESPWIIVLLFGVVFIGSIFTAKKMRFELFPGDDVRTVYLQLKGPVGMSRDRTDAAMKKIEAMALSELEKNEYEQIRASIGAFRGSQARRTGPQYASLVLYLTDPTQRERSTDEIVEALVGKAKKIAIGFEVSTRKIQGGPPKGRPVDLELTGESLSELLASAKALAVKLATVNGILSTEIDYEEGKEQWAITVDDIQSRRLGLTVPMVIQELRLALAGDNITEIRQSDEDIEIILALDDKFRKNMQAIRPLEILNQSGQRVRLDRVARFEKRPSAFIINRLNGKRVVSLSADLDKKKTTPVKAVKDFRPMADEIMKDFAGVSISYGGENKDTKESMQRLLKSGVIAFTCILGILIVMFNSIGQAFVILSAVPLGLIGVVATFFILGRPLGFMALMGVVALIGVVVNDSIVLVSFINRRRKEVGELIPAVIDGGISRLRPVLLTTFTTVAGLLPIAHSVGGDPFLKPMALSFAWGLLASTFVTLVFVPSAYVIHARLLGRVRKFFKKV